MGNIKFFSTIFVSGIRQELKELYNGELGFSVATSRNHDCLFIHVVTGPHNLDFKKLCKQINTFLESEKDIDLSKVKIELGKFPDKYNNNEN